MPSVKPTTIIDHLVYGVHDLESACDWFEKQSGCRPVFGGYHTTQGTKNALVGLGENCYLEFITIDKANRNVLPPRWMGIDLLQSPKLIRWAVLAKDLERETTQLMAFRPDLSKISIGHRKTNTGENLKWQMTLPAPSPEVEVLPFLLDWTNSPIHPSQQLEKKCQLLELELTHPDVDRVRQQLLFNIRKLSIKSGPIAISARLQTPKGEVMI